MRGRHAVGSRRRNLRQFSRFQAAYCAQIRQFVGLRRCRIAHHARKEHGVTRKRLFCQRHTLLRARLVGRGEHDLRVKRSRQCHVLRGKENVFRIRLNALNHHIFFAQRGHFAHQSVKPVVGFARGD